MAQEAICPSSRVPRAIRRKSPMGIGEPRTEGGKTTQAHLYTHTHVPKATLSRRLASLDVEKAEDQDDGQSSGEKDGRLEVKREGVDGEVPPEERRRGRRRQAEGDPGGADPGQGDIARRPPPALAGEEMDEQGGHRRREQDELGGEGAQPVAGGNDHRVASK